MPIAIMETKLFFYISHFIGKISILKKTIRYISKIRVNNKNSYSSSFVAKG